MSVYSSVAVAVLLFLFISCEHGLDVSERRVSEGSEIHVDEDKGCKEYKDKNMDRIHHLYPT